MEDDVLVSGTPAERLAALNTCDRKRPEDVVRLSTAVCHPANEGPAGWRFREAAYERLARSGEEAADAMFLHALRHEPALRWIDLNYIISGRRGQLTRLPAALRAALAETPVPTLFIERCVELLSGRSDVDRALLNEAARAASMVVVAEASEDRPPTLSQRLAAMKPLAKHQDDLLSMLANRGSAAYEVPEFLNEAGESYPQEQRKKALEDHQEYLLEQTRSGDARVRNQALDLLDGLAYPREAMRDLVADLPPSVSRYRLMHDRRDELRGDISTTLEAEAIAPLPDGRALAFGEHVPLRRGASGTRGSKTLHLIDAGGVVTSVEMPGSPVSYTSLHHEGETRVAFVLVDDKVRVAWFRIEGDDVDCIATRNTSRHSRVSAAGGLTVLREGKTLLGLRGKRRVWESACRGGVLRASGDPDRVYLGTSSKLTCLDAATGAECFVIDGPGTAGAPAHDHVSVLIHAGRGYAARGRTLTVFDPSKGKRIDEVLLPFLSHGVSLEGDQVVIHHARGGTTNPLLICRPTPIDPSGVIIHADGRHELRIRGGFDEPLRFAAGESTVRFDPWRGVALGDGDDARRWHLPDADLIGPRLGDTLWVRGRRLPLSETRRHVWYALRLT